MEVVADISSEPLGTNTFELIDTIVLTQFWKKVVSQDSISVNTVHLIWINKAVPSIDSNKVTS